MGFLTLQTPKKRGIDLGALDARLDELDAMIAGSKYGKQKTALERELEGFLAALPEPKQLASTTPGDLRRFLVWKDKGGKTPVHTVKCDLLGQKSQSNCGCPVRLAANSVASLIGKLRAIFQSHGCKKEWDDLRGLWNPAAAPDLKRYKKPVSLESKQNPM